MKKLMMSAVLLLPLVVLMILLVSGSIIGRTTHIYVEALAFSNPKRLVLVMDDENNPPSEQLEVSVNPSEATNKKLEYSSKDESVVKVDKNTGLVTAVGYGETIITVTSVENNALSITREVIVTDNKIHKLVFSNNYPTRIYTNTKSNPQLLMDVIPNKYDESVGIPEYVFEFKSSNPGVLDITQFGVLTPHSVGEATITVSLKNNASVKPVVTTTIKVVNPLESITFEKSGSGAASIIASAEAVFPAVKLNDGADEKIEYTSSNPAIATVDATGHIYFAHAGRVTITATARDEQNNVKSISKEYTCTQGYYLGNLFPQERYTVDFDEIIASGSVLPITISETPEGAKQEIVEVKFNRDDVIAFDSQTKTFTLVGNENELGEVVVTIRARKYNPENDEIEEFSTDGCLINIERNVQSIEVNFEKESDNIINLPTVNIMADFADYIKINPTVHTNKFSYEVTSGSATVDADGILRFTSQSSATVKITAKNNTQNPASASITVIYSKIAAGDVRLVYNGVESEEKNLTLKIYDDENKEKGVVTFTSLPDGITSDMLGYLVTSGEDTILRLETVDDVVKIVPLKGGYGTVSITANVPGENGSTTKTWVVNVYVDRQVDEITLTPNADVTTSLASYPYKVVVTPEDAMAGKELHISGVADPITTNTYNGSLEFNAQGSQTITAFVSYKGNPNAILGTTVIRTFTSTFGTLSEHPKITRKDTSVELSATETNKFTLNNIGESIQFKIDTSSFIPADYVFNASDVSVSVNTNYISYAISSDGTTITLTGVNGCEGEPVSITVKNKTFNLKGTVVVKADYLNVTYGDIVFISGNGNYLTFADTIDFKVTPARRDQKTVTEAATLHWTYGVMGADSATGDVNVTLDNSGSASANKITFTYGELIFVVNVQKVSAVSDFGIQAYYTDGQIKELDPITSVASQTGEIYYKFPSSIQNQFMLHIMLPDNVIGGFGTDSAASSLFASKFSVTNVGDWIVSHDPFNAHITLIATTKTERTITLNHGMLSQSITFGFVDIKRIEALGFSMAKEDVYLGYQQVRVFAKNSYYNGATVNYFKMPLNVQGTLRYLNFKFERYVNNAQQNVITTQDGYTVISGGTTYTIKKLSEYGTEYGLFDASGTDVSNSGITWADVFSEPGYARIYFGDFAGLSDSDVYNDYFGNYGEQENWQQYTNIVDDGSGRNVTPSANAGAFMRIEANDGIADSSVTPWHFNFNVLDDASLTNIDTAAGYLAFPNGKVVLQHSLYGRAERKDANGKALPDDEYTLETIIGIESWEKKDNGKYDYVFAWWELNLLQKEIIYGNGFQVNFETFNRQVINAYAGNPETTWYPSDLPKGKVTSNGGNNLFFGSFINVTIKGANVNEQGRNDKEVYAINFSTLWEWPTNYCYYSDILSWRKGLDIWGGHTAYIKNLAMRYMPEFAIKINNDSTGYIENIVIAESAMAIRNSGDNGIMKFKGYQDIFCYGVADDLVSALVTESLIDTVRKFKLMDSTLQSVYNYSEWFGNDGGKSTSEYRYINFAVLCENAGAPKRKLYFWDESTHAYQERLDKSNPGELRQGASKDIKIPLTNIGVQMAVWSYDNLSSVDGGLATYKKFSTDTAKRIDWSKLFTDERYIRLLCEFKTKDGNTLISNGEHLQWHFNRVYRDGTLLGENGWHLEGHTTNLQESLVGVTWKDASSKTYNANDYIAADIVNRVNSKRASAYLALPQKITDFIIPQTNIA